MNWARNEERKKICKGCKYARDVEVNPCALYVDCFINYRKERCSYKEEK